MRVVLTLLQIKAIEQACATDTVLLEELSLERERVTERQVGVTAPYVAWDLVRRAMVEAVYSPAGGIRKLTRSPSLTATRRVVAALNAADRHPALRGAAVAGGKPAALYPAWRIPDGPDQYRRIYSPMPILGAEFVVLVPQGAEVGGMGVTVWRPDDLGISKGIRFAEERVHLALFRDESIVKARDPHLG